MVRVTFLIRVMIFGFAVTVTVVLGAGGGVRYGARRAGGQDTARREYEGDDDRDGRPHHPVH